MNSPISTTTSAFSITYNSVINAPAFVIHMEKAAERKPFFMRNIVDAGFTDIQIWLGVNADDDTELKAELNKLENLKIHSKMGRGPIGCLLSHLSVLHYIVQNNISIATIFEDDVHFHPHWANLAPNYFENTPTDFDIIFMGNQVDECMKYGIIKTDTLLPPHINKCSNFCTHAYIITQKGAQKLIQLLLSWDWWSKYAAVETENDDILDGLYCIDIMIKNVQKRILTGQLPSNILKWYCWCGMYYMCDYNKAPLSGINIKNCGLVFQCDKFPSLK